MKGKLNIDNFKWSYQIIIVIFTILGWELGKLFLQF